MKTNANRLIETMGSAMSGAILILTLWTAVRPAISHAFVWSAVGAVMNVAAAEMASNPAEPTDDVASCEAGNLAEAIEVRVESIRADAETLGGCEDTQVAEADTDNRPLGRSEPGRERCAAACAGHAGRTTR